MEESDDDGAFENADSLDDENADDDNGDDDGEGEGDYAEDDDGLIELDLPINM